MLEIEIPVSLLFNHQLGDDSERRGPGGSLHTVGRGLESPTFVELGECNDEG